MKIYTSLRETEEGYERSVVMIDGTDWEIELEKTAEGEEHEEQH